MWTDFENTLYKESIKPVMHYTAFMNNNVISKLVSPRNYKKVFFMQGIYPFYLMGVLLISLFFYFSVSHDPTSPQDNLRMTCFNVTLVLKAIVAVVLPLNRGREVVIDKGYEMFLTQRRFDLMRFFIRETRSVQIFRSGKCQMCRKLVCKYEKHSFLF
jgi:hypothetical protein